MHPPAVAYMTRKQAEGMSYRDALRCLKRHISRALFKTMLRTERAQLAPAVEADFWPGPVTIAV